MKLVICDIDGTISIPGDRVKYLQQEPKDWDRFYAECTGDEPVQPICDMLSKLGRVTESDLEINSPLFHVVFLTGRKRCCEKQTRNWIDAHIKGIYYSLVMRQDDDNRPDTEAKPELLANFLQHSARDHDGIALILEDRPDMVKKWRELGYICLQVSDGEYAPKDFSWK